MNTQIKHKILSLPINIIQKVRLIAMNVAILGATDNEDRYAYRAMRLLLNSGYNIYPINPTIKEVQGIQTFGSIKDIPEQIDTLTVYINPTRLLPLMDEIIAIKPGRVILNPGTESDQIETILRDNNIICIKGCTIVMLKTGQF